MFTVLSYAIAVVIGLAILYAYSNSRDVFHPLVYIGPMMAFMYAWMPLKLDSANALAGFFQRDQLDFIQVLNLSGILCFILGCLSPGSKLPSSRVRRPRISPHTLTIAATVVGCIGLAAWATMIINVGGLAAAFSQSERSAGSTVAIGWDDSGYVRDASLLLYPAFLLLLQVAFREGFKISYLLLMTVFMTPMVVQAVATSRRGPTFMIAVILAMGWFMNKKTRPSLALTAAAGLALGFLMLFLVSNRGTIYAGTNDELSVDVTEAVERPDTGNEFIYGTGSVLSTEQRNAYYWGRRYLAQIVARPVPRSIWPNKYEDIGVPELTHNGGTGEGFAETLGWEGAEGSAPGIISDLWMELWWLCLPALFLLGLLYATAWRRAMLRGGCWTLQYVILAALSVYFVMQTMEAVIFRLLLMSIPMWIAWRVSQREGRREPGRESKVHPIAPGLAFALRAYSQNSRGY
jgi:hypothetical protein